MYRLIIAVVLCATFSACNTAEDHGPLAQIWRASDENGDKPGIGYELRTEGGKVSGEAYILDPGFPHDFSRGKRAAMAIVGQSPGEITFRVKWNRDLDAVLRFRFKDEVWLDSFPVDVSEIIDSQPYDSETYTFKRTKGP
jgi:hypothetical protein